MEVKRKGSTKRTNTRNELETYSNTRHSNYFTPLTSQVEEPAYITHEITIFEKN